MSKTSLNSVNVAAQPKTTIGAIVEKVRQLSSVDSEIRVRVDNTANTVVAFTATWVNRSSMPNHRRTFIETKVVDGVYRVIFSVKLFDENSAINEYAGDTVALLAGDIMRFLRNGDLVERRLAMAA